MKSKFNKFFDLFGAQLTRATQAEVIQVFDRWQEKGSGEKREDVLSVLTYCGIKNIMLPKAVEPKKSISMRYRATRNSGADEWIYLVYRTSAKNWKEEFKETWADQNMSGETFEAWRGLDVQEFRMPKNKSEHRQIRLAKANASSKSHKFKAKEKDLGEQLVLIERMRVLGLAKDTRS